MRLLLLVSENNSIRKLENCLRGDFILDFESNGPAAVYSAQSDLYSLILIDSKFGDFSGEQICKLIRKQKVKLPILMLCEGGHVPNIVSCLKLGADDCIDRVFNPIELKARIKALLRRFSPVIPADNIYRIKDICIDLWKQAIIKDNEEIRLRRKEFKLLQLFLSNKGRALSRNRIFDALWDEEGIRSFNIVDVYVCYLRRSLRELVDADLIHTIYGYGYIFDDSKLQKQD